MQERADALRAQGRTPYIIPEGGSNALGSLGYVRSMLEIVQSAENLDFIITAVGSGGTLAGLLAGAQITNTRAQIIGVPVCDDGHIFAQRVNLILQDLRTHIPELTIQSHENNFCDGHVGSGYALATKQELQQISTVVKDSGLVLDPVYTNKAFSGMLAMIKNARIPQQSKVLFLHTGGIFGLAPFAENFPVAD
jgi:D-cysteine desulfhydrase